VEDIVTAESTSQRSLAIATVRQKRVYHVPEAGTFVVEGSFVLIGVYFLMLDFQIHKNRAKVHSHNNSGDNRKITQYCLEMPMSVIRHVLSYNSSSYDTEFGQHRQETGV
jgi:hypothetical protein